MVEPDMQFHISLKSYNNRKSASVKVSSLSHVIRLKRFHLLWLQCGHCIDLKFDGKNPMMKNCCWGKAAAAAMVAATHTDTVTKKKRTRQHHLTITMSEQRSRRCLKLIHIQLEICSYYFKNSLFPIPWQKNNKLRGICYISVPLGGAESTITKQTTFNGRLVGKLESLDKVSCLISKLKRSTCAFHYSIQYIARFRRN